MLKTLMFHDQKHLKAVWLLELFAIEALRRKPINNTHGVDPIDRSGMVLEVRHDVLHFVLHPCAGWWLRKIIYPLLDMI